MLLSHASTEYLRRQHPCRLTSLAQLDKASATFCRPVPMRSAKLPSPRLPQRCLAHPFPTSLLLFPWASFEHTTMRLQRISDTLSSVLKVKFDGIHAHAEQAAGRSCALRYRICRCSGKVRSMLMAHMSSPSSGGQQSRAAIHVLRGFPRSSITQQVHDAAGMSQYRSRSSRLRARQSLRRRLCWAAARCGPL